MTTQIDANGRAKCCCCGQVKPVWSTYAGPNEDGEVSDPLCRECSPPPKRARTVETID